MGIIKTAIEKARETKKPIGKEELSKAAELLQKYKQGKTNLEQRIITDEDFYRLRYNSKAGAKSKPSTAWLLNSVINKHADLMDNYPEAVCLPREQSDEDDAKVLSEIIPVVMENNGYEKTYSGAAWYYIKHGMCAQGVFWDSTKENGLGDIAIKNIDILNLFWEPGITDIQDSANLFYVSLADSEALKATYPELADVPGGEVINVSQYNYDESVDTSDKTLVVDWYYKKALDDGRTVLHYVKFCGNTVLFASENEQGYENGFYEHGTYPFSVACMYPEAGTPVGFGIIAVCRDPQQYIDTLDGLMLDYVYKTANPRYWCKKSAGVNEKDFLDWSKPIVTVEGDIDEEKLRQITMQSMGTAIQNIRQMKVDELKETSSNRDFSQGSTASGVTSGAAIATLQEAGNKTSRDMMKALYRSYTEVVSLAVELIRQFYTEEREFRITGENGSYRFIKYSNEGLREQEMKGPDGETMYRKPIFDIDVRAEKSNAFSKLSQNETAVNLYNMGIFVPENAQPALAMLEIMDFDGKEKVKQYVAQGATLQNVINQQQQVIAQLQQQLGMMIPQSGFEGQGYAEKGYSPPSGEVKTTSTAEGTAARAQNYTDTLLKKASGMND